MPGGERGDIQLRGPRIHLPLLQKLSNPTLLERNPPTRAGEVCTCLLSVTSNILSLYCHHIICDLRNLDNHHAGRLRAGLEGLSVSSGCPSIKTGFSSFIPVAFSIASVNTSRGEEKGESWMVPQVAFCVDLNQTALFCLNSSRT